MILQILLLCVGFVLLVKGADFFVDGAAGIAGKLGIPQLIVGLTIVAMGTSLPEAAVSITSALKGSAGITIGNVVGSNIMNVLVILGITAVITNVAIQKSTLYCEIPFMIGITALMIVFGITRRAVSFPEGVIFWILFIAFLAYLFVMSKKNKAAEEEDECQMSYLKCIIFIIAGGIMVVWGSDLVVDAASEIARAFGMSERFIGLTIVAFGTSLPELVTSVTAAKSGNAGIAEKLSQFGGRQFQRTNSLNNHAVFFFLTLFLQIPDFGLPLGGFLTGLRQLFVDFFKFGHG